MTEALYRKYRPSTFRDIVGQEHIERTLKNAIEQDKVSHAYLFCGPRGTGKTTTARILAKALLCEKGPTTDPDGTCEECLAIANGNHPDVYELDAASRTGVENVREEIISRVNYAPTRGQYKVYIIDEVHMLSTAAFNALLKTLEEPPSHVIFILCTTDPQKVPETIHSRCQRFDFHRISVETIVSRLGAVCVQEQVEFEPEALELVAYRSDGGMRNALTSLEQLIAFGEGKVTLSGAQNLLGSLDDSGLSEIVQSIGRRDAAACFMWVSRYVETGADLAQFVLDLAEHLRNLYLLRVTKGEVELPVPDSSREMMKKEMPLYSADRLSRLLGILDEVIKELRVSSNPRLSFEIALTRMVRPESDLTLEALLERIEALEQRLSGVINPANNFAIPIADKAVQTQQPLQQNMYAVQQNANSVSAPVSFVSPNVRASGSANSTAKQPTFTQPNQHSAIQAASGQTRQQIVQNEDLHVSVQSNSVQPQAKRTVSNHSLGKQNQSVSERMRNSQTQPEQAQYTPQFQKDNASAVAGSAAVRPMDNSTQVQPIASKENVRNQSSAAVQNQKNQSAQPNASVQQPASLVAAPQNVVSSVAGSSGAGSVDLSNPAKVQRMWHSVVTQLRKTNPARGVLFMNAQISSTEQNEFLVEFSAESGFAYNAAQKPEVQELLSQTIQSVLGAAIPFRLKIAGQQASPAVRGAAFGAALSGSGKSGDSHMQSGTREALSGKPITGGTTPDSDASVSVSVSGAVAKSRMASAAGSATVAQDTTRNSDLSNSDSASSVADGLGMVGVVRNNAAGVVPRPQGAVNAVNKSSSANSFVNTTNSTPSLDSDFSDDDRVPLDIYDSFVPSQVNQSYGSNSFRAVAARSNALESPLTQPDTVMPPWEDDNPNAAPTVSSFTTPSLSAAGVSTTEVVSSSQVVQDQSFTGGLSETEEIKNILTASFGEGIKFEKVDD